MVCLRSFVPFLIALKIYSSFYPYTSYTAKPWSNSKPRSANFKFYMHSPTFLGSGIIFDLPLPFKREASSQRKFPFRSGSSRRPTNSLSGKGVPRSSSHYCNEFKLFGEWTLIGIIAELDRLREVVFFLEAKIFGLKLA